MPKTRKSWWWIALALVVGGGHGNAGHHARPARAQSPRVTVEFWHGLAMPLGGILEKIVTDFNESQTQYQVNPTFKGSYPETMVGAIAAFRAGNAPHIVQMFEVGTATMMSARGAIKPVHELMKESGVAFDPAAYLPSVAGYYSLPDGRMMAMPFNSSTTIMFYNKDAFKKAGLDPTSRPRPGPISGRRPRRSARPTRRPAASPPRGRRGRSSSSSAPSTTCRWPPRPTAWPGSTPSSRSTARCTSTRADPDRHAEGRQLQVRRPRRGGRRAVPLRGVRDHPRLVRAARPHRAGGQVRVGRGHAARTTRARPTRRRTPSSAAPPSG